jgi:hypothetical protein
MQNFKLKLIDQKEPPKKEEPKLDKATTILDDRFDYTPAVSTDLAARFKAMGFKAKPKKPRFGK